MPSLRTLFRAARPAAESAAPETTGPAKLKMPQARVFGGDEADGPYLRNPHGMLQMDPETAEAYVAAMAG